MPSQAPTRFNNYLVNDETNLSSDVWNGSVGDLANRMLAVEQKATGYDAIVQAGIGVAIVRVNDSLEPAIEQINALIVQGQAYLSQLTATGIAATLVTTDTTHRFTNDTEIAIVASVAGLVTRIAALESFEAMPTAGKAYFLSTM